MSSRPGKILRLSEFINPEDNRSVILKADQGMVLGPIKGIVNLEDAIGRLRDKVDAVVLSPGQAGRIFKNFMGKAAPSLIVRADWTNVFRDESFVLPAQRIKHVTVASASEALALGASGVAAFFFVGYEDDEEEARNMNAVASLARECDNLGVPLMIEAMPIGSRVTKTNYVECIDLAMRMSIEAGADAVAVPYTGDRNSFTKIVDAAKVPIFTFDFGNTTKSSLEIIEEALEAGASGMIVGKRTLREDDLVEVLRSINTLVHEEIG
ncbi:MAG: class I fructose-bisphosphate aldolase [Candidatus Bathyarchaeia archaeon]